MRKPLTIKVPTQLELLARHNPTAQMAGQMKQAGLHGGKKPKYSRHPKHKGRAEGEAPLLYCF